MNKNLYYLTGFLIAAACGIICTFLTKKFALKNHIVNNPNPIVAQHKKAIAYLGGAGVFLAFLMSYILTHLTFIKEFLSNEKIKNRVQPEDLLICGFAFLTLGIYDDLKVLKPLRKFTLQFFIAIFCVWFGIRSEIFHHSVYDFIFSVFWILTVINAVNFTDVCDGLVSSVSIIIFLLCGLFLPHSNLLCFIIAGSTAGFFVFNSPRASIFLGDGGSHLLGFLIAAFTLKCTKDMNFLDGILWMFLISGIFLFELIFITSIRIKKGKPWWKGSPDHFSLRLQKAGFTRWQIIFGATIITAAIVFVGCKMKMIDISFKIISLLIFFIISVLCWRYLLKWEVEN
jgi:UDP-GlcNAc:undecaprenyl-phosphate GlcNAc-1-phosphate transferase